jgi:hypothetical protein
MAPVEAHSNFLLFRGINKQAPCSFSVNVNC